MGGVSLLQIINKRFIYFGFKHIWIFTSSAKRVSNMRKSTSRNDFLVAVFLIEVHAFT